VLYLHWLFIFVAYSGLYVSRNTYIHTGVTEWQFKKTVNVVWWHCLVFCNSSWHIYKSWSLWTCYYLLSYWFDVLNFTKLLVLIYVQVCYYRYLRFFPSGKFLYKVPIHNSHVLIYHSRAYFSLAPFILFFSFIPVNYQISPDKVKDAVKCMHFRASKADCVFKGDYVLSEDGQVRVQQADLFFLQLPFTFFLIWATLCGMQIEMALLYPGHRYTLVRMHLRYFVWNCCPGFDDFCRYLASEICANILQA
jgi:F-box protein 9